MAGVQAWVVWVWVVCLASHAHGQLGVWGEDTQGSDTPTTTTTDLLQDTHGKGRQGGREDAGSGRQHYGSVVRGKEKRWRPLLDTYQGCYEEVVFNGTLVYVNLTQVMELNHLESVEHACFHMCSNKKPLSSMFIAVSPAVSSGTDGCGCQDTLESSNEVDNETCDDVVEHYRVYCGPANDQCLNHGGRVTNSLPLLYLPLAALVYSLVTSYGDV